MFYFRVTTNLDGGYSGKSGNSERVNSGSEKTKNVAINYVLPLNAIANLKSFWGPGHQRPNFDSFIYIHYAAPPYPAGIRISAIYLLFGEVWVPFADIRVQRLTMKQKAEFTEGE